MGGDSVKKAEILDSDREPFLRFNSAEAHWSSNGEEQNKKLGPQTTETELRLGPPGDWFLKTEKNSNSESHESLLSLGKTHEHSTYFSGVYKNSNSAGAKRGFSDTVDGEEPGNQIQKFSGEALFSSQIQKPPFLHLKSLQNLPVLAKESQTNAQKLEIQSHQKNPCSSSSTAADKSAVNSSGQRAAVPVVGWPPIRSSRRNLASCSSKPATESQDGATKICEKSDNCSKKGLFVKINMDGVPIGRKVDLNACNSYQKLSVAVDELFRNLLAAQRDASATGNQNGSNKEQPITGLLDGNGEYTLVYEDHEGDRMLVGDVPWEMFVTSVKRLRVLKSCEVSVLCNLSIKQGGSKATAVTTDL